MRRTNDAIAGALALACFWAAAEAVRRIDWATFYRDDVRPVMGWDWRPSPAPVGEGWTVAKNETKERK